PDKPAYLTQTTLSVDETRAIINRLRARFPNIVGPRTDDICYATTNRQAAVKQMAEQCDLVLVIGSRNSSNSNRLVEVARDHGADSYLLELRDGPRGATLEVARGFFEDLGAALGDRRVTIVPGNHDYPLIAPWVSERRARGEQLGLEHHLTPAEGSPTAAALAGWLGE